MRFGSDELEILLNLVADAASGGSFAEKMASVAEAIGKVVPCSSVSAFVLDKRPGGEPETTQAFFEGQETKTILEYARHYRHIDPMGATIESATGTPSLMSDFVHGRAFGGDAFTGDFLGALRVRHIMGVTHLMPDGARFAFALQRLHGREDFSAKERELVRLVIPHVSRGAFLATFREKITSLDSPTRRGRGGGVLAHGGRVVHADPDAIAVLAALAGGEPDPEDAFTGLLESLVPADAPPGSIFERTARLPEGLLVLIRLCVSGVGRARVLGTVEVLVPGSRAAFDAVAGAANLSRREREVAALATRGEGNRSIASHLGISRPTIAVVLSRVYRKLGVGGRQEMAAALAGFASNVKGSPPRSASGAPRIRP